MNSFIVSSQVVWLLKYSTYLQIIPRRNLQEVVTNGFSTCWIIRPIRFVHLPVTLRTSSQVGSAKSLNISRIFRKNTIFPSCYIDLFQSFVAVRLWIFDLFLIARLGVCCYLFEMKHNANRIFVKMCHFFICGFIFWILFLSNMKCNALNAILLT